MKNLTLCILGVALLAACENGGSTSPSFGFGPSGLIPATSNTTSTSSGTSGVDTPAAPGDVEVIGLDRAGVRHETSCLTVRLFVPAANADYVNVWSPSVNEKLLATGPANEWFEFTLPAGTYQIQLAVEKRKEGGGVWQDDRTHFTIPLVDCGSPRTPEEPPDVCPNLEGNQSQVPEGLVLIEGQCVEPPQGCDEIQRWVVDIPAWDEVVTDVAAYDEEVTTCVPQPPLPGEPVTIGWTYKLTNGNNSDRREQACTAIGDYSGFSPAGAYALSTCIPGNGAVDACVFSVDQGMQFERQPGNANTKVTFNDVDECNLVVPGEPIPQPDICTTEIVHHDAVTHVVHHDEVGHFVTVCAD